MAIDDYWGFPSPSHGEHEVPQSSQLGDLTSSSISVDSVPDGGYDEDYFLAPQQEMYEFDAVEPDESLTLPVQARPLAAAREDTRSRVLRVIRSVLSSVDRMDSGSAMQLVQRIEASPRVLGFLSEKDRVAYAGVLEVLAHEASVLESGRLSLAHLPVASEYSDEVVSELAKICAEVGRSTPEDPHAEWADLVEVVQRVISRTQAQSLVDAIDAKSTVAELVEKHRKIEPPTTRKSASRRFSARTARAVVDDFRAATAGRPSRRFSSGLPTLDRGYTGSGEALGFVGEGTFNVVMGPTGTGKTSFSYSCTPAFGLDLHNWGLRDATQVFFHTEEESIDKIRGFRMEPGGKFHHLAENLVIDAVGTSRRRMAETLYDLVVAADERSRRSKRPITEFLPYVVQLDYIQSIQEPGEDPTTATAVTAEFLLRGVCAWNPEEMAKFSGVDFREYAGQAWPSGMEHHRVAVVAYAQLVKISDETLYYKAGKRGVQLSDFVLLDDKDDPHWDVREGDLRLFGKNQMRGSGVIAQNAHSIVILHRSVPYNNPSSRGEDGFFHLADTRARILFDKSRAGSRLPYAPMRFDVQASGFRAQYFDELAERAVAAGKLAVDASYVDPGDPMLPVRPRVSPLAACRYA